VITYDRRGRNESGDTAPYAIEREVEDIEALIIEAGGSAYVYGISSGAMLALIAAGKLPTRVKKLALYEPPLVLDDSRPPIPEDYLEQFEEMLASGRRGDMVEHFMTKGVGMPIEAVAPMRTMPMWPALESVAHTLIYDTIIMGDFSLSTELSKLAASIRVLTLVMGGGASPESLQSAVRAVAGAIPEAQLRMLDGQTHEVAPDAIAPVLVEFFAA
jgi:pimeloyl-ACP methyl ester carboxylesterase